MEALTVSARRSAAVGAAAVGASWLGAHLRSEAVRSWVPSTLPDRTAGGLFVRSGGEGAAAVVLLHGLIATGDVYGAAFDSLARRFHVVVPDLLGFGRSLDERRHQFSATDHMDALDAALAELGASDIPLILGGHSMGASLAVRWATRLGERARAIVAWGPPVFADAEAVKTTISESGLMARMFVADERVARRVCRINCRHRTLAGWAAAATHPSLPVPIARSASLHTWPAYQHAMVDLVAGTDWSRLAAELDAQGTSLHLVWGSDDRIGDRGLARRLKAARLTELAGGDHRLPLSHGAACAAQVTEAAGAA